MLLELDYNGNKAFRLLSIFERLNKGELLNKNELASVYNVTLKTIQRDIDDLRAYLAETHFSDKEILIKYSRTNNGYYLVHSERECLTNKEVLAVCKVLLESRAFEKDELSQMLNKLIVQAGINDSNLIRKIISNEYRNYIPLRHSKDLVMSVWQVSQLIINKQIIEFTYKRQDGIEIKKSVQPVSILFSESYFYLVAFDDNASKAFPLVYCIDQMSDIKGSPKDTRGTKSEELTQLVCKEEMKTIRFEYNEIPEIAFKEIPTAKVLGEEKGKYIISVKTYGRGIDKWIESQGDKLSVL